MSTPLLRVKAPRWLAGILWSAGARRPHVEPMPDKFEVLAVYNAEVYRGIPHTPEYDARMAALQEEFNRWAEATR